jgi:endonuclease-3 related protein
MTLRKSKRDLILQAYELLFAHFGPQHWWPGDTPFEIMVGAILTQNTNWRNVRHAIENIKKKKLLEPKQLYKHRRTIPSLIKPSGFYRLKSRRLTAFLKYYIAQYDADMSAMKRVPTARLRSQLLDVPGIGPETADSILLYAVRRPVFVVDAYTRRIFSRHGLFDTDPGYEEISSLFERHVPRRLKVYSEYHALIVRCAKDFCRKHDPRCTDCPLYAV